MNLLIILAGAALILTWWAAKKKPASGGFRAAMDHAERQLLADALAEAGGNKSAAAEALGRIGPAAKAGVKVLEAFANQKQTETSESPLMMTSPRVPVIVVVPVRFLPSASPVSRSKTPKPTWR